jgi:hypothetical protein
MVPVGSIIPWAGASYLNGSNGSPVYMVGGSGVANLSTYLGEGWTICDGRTLPTDSPLRTGGNIYAPNLTDRYLRGASTFGAPLGNNTYAINGSTASFNNTVNANNATYNFSGNVSGLSHTHSMIHTHQWGYFETNNTFRVSAESDRNVANWTNTGGSGGMISLMNYPYKTGSSNAFAAFTQTGYASRLWTGGPVGNGTQASPPVATPSTGNGLTGTYPVSGNIAVSGNPSIPASGLNAAQSNHNHSLTSSEVLPSYLSVIYIIRVK